MTFCVYALLARPRGRAPRLGSGVSGERLRIVGDGPVAAVVGHVDRPPAVTPDLLRRYERTIAAIAANVPALLPVRFGTCFETLDDLAFVLRSRRRALRQGLAHVRNRVQMTVRVLDGVSRESIPRVVPKGSVTAGSKAKASGGRAGDGRAYLRARAEAAAREREIAGFAPVYESVRRWVRDEQVEKRAGIATVYHLVPRRSADRYRVAVERAASAAGLQVIVTGPWAPYAFATW